MNKNVQLRYPCLDGIKAIACLLVFAYHYWLVFGHVFWGLDFFGDKLNFVYYGRYWVQFFYLISAFLLGKSLYAKCDTTQICNVVIKRYFRLTLPVLGVCILIFGMSKLGMFQNERIVESILNKEEFKLLYQDGFSVKEVIIKPLTMLFCDNDINKFNFSFWMLRPLFWGNMITMGIVIFTNANRKKDFFAFAVALLIGVCCAREYLAFFLGTLLARIHCDTKLHYKKSIWQGVLCGLFIIVGVTLVEMGWQRDDINAISVFCLMAGVLGVSWICRCLSLKPLVAVGKVSYYVFLIHCPVIYSLSYYLFIEMNGMASHTTVVRIIFLVTLLVILLVAWLMAKYLDRLFGQITNKILYLFNK